MISSPFSSSKRITDIFFFFVGRCYVLKELDSGIVNLLRLGILGPLVASSLRADNYSSRPRIPKRSRFTIPESNYYLLHGSACNMTRCFMSRVSIVTSRRRVEIQSTSEMTPYFTMTKCNNYCLLHILLTQLNAYHLFHRVFKPFKTFQ